MTERTLENKVAAAYHHGRMDYLADIPFNAKTPLRVYAGLREEEQAHITEAYTNGYMSEVLMLSLPDWSPA